jgi:hypothetical protein
VVPIWLAVPPWFVRFNLSQSVALRKASRETHSSTVQAVPCPGEIVGYLLCSLASSDPCCGQFYILQLSLGDPSVRGY